MVADDMTGSCKPSTAVIEAIAEREGVESEELKLALADVIDPDAIDALVASFESDGQMRFRYAEYLITVNGDGEVFVTEENS